MFVIYHNPKCSTSRKVLDQIREAGHAPVVIDYLKDGWTRGELWGLFAAAGVTPAQALRVKNTPAEELGLIGADDEATIAAMVAHPVLVERPIVAAPKGVRLCRPVERLQELL
ncbi:arsenate reductase family protein [Paracoccus aminophilus]|uniref:Arsenate reductase n=1 Tax=Paracoccus aminophilus JCM 7686 TaxID=1367847 RepID=S5XK13_PARAH|nr:arsenate reductase family protein [Paracoccus aminophilus]AGT07519.1 arsenate reductase [Paracoccus aminophilus JCM 7686]